MKNGSSDVQQAELYYRTYEQGGTAGSFNLITGGWLEDLGGGNQKWGKSTSTNIDITSLTAGKTWVLEVYIRFYGTPEYGWKYDSNDGANFIATFTTDSAFPVQLTNFTAKLFDNNISLDWQTSTEVNNYGFNVECKVNNDEWKTIGFV